MFKYILLCALFLSALSVPLHWDGIYHVINSTSNNTRCEVPEHSTRANITMTSVLGVEMLVLTAPIQGSGVTGQWSLGWESTQVNASNCLLHAWCINGTLTQRSYARYAHISWSFAEEHILCETYLTTE